MEWKEVSGKRSEVWKHALLKPNDDTIAKCKYCPATFNVKNSTTSSLLYHLEKKEKIKFKKCHDSKEDKEPKQVSIRGCLGRKKDLEKGDFSQESKVHVPKSLE
jgi:hypothetical protein